MTKSRLVLFGSGVIFLLVICFAPFRITSVTYSSTKQPKEVFSTSADSAKKLGMWFEKNETIFVREKEIRSGLLLVSYVRKINWSPDELRELRESNGQK